MEIGGLSKEKDLMLFEKFVRQASCHNVLEQNFNPIFELLMVNNDWGFVCKKKYENFSNKLCPNVYSFEVWL